MLMLLKGKVWYCSCSSLSCCCLASSMSLSCCRWSSSMLIPLSSNLFDPFRRLAWLFLHSSKTFHWFYNVFLLLIQGSGYNTPIQNSVKEGSMLCYSFFFRCRLFFKFLTCTLERRLLRKKIEKFREKITKPELFDRDQPFQGILEFQVLLKRGQVQWFSFELAHNARKK